MSKLYIVATPIGNLKDITFRALEALKSVDLIVCEDTRVTKKLLVHYQIEKPTLSYHQHSKLTRIKEITGLLKAGKDIALVSDAGTPGISDPGGKLVSILVNEFMSKKNKNSLTHQLINSLTIIPIPGPSALTVALSISGLPADKFLFLGFPPHKKGRQKFFKQVAESKYTVVFYESPHRILKSLGQLKESLSDKREIVVCRELTKKFETVYRGDIDKVIEAVEADEVKGEFVVIVAPLK